MHKLKIAYYRPLRFNPFSSCSKRRGLCCGTCSYWPFSLSGAPSGQRPPLAHRHQILCFYIIHWTEPFSTLLEAFPISCSVHSPPGFRAGLVLHSCGWVRAIPSVDDGQGGWVSFTELSWLQGWPIKIIKSYCRVWVMLASARPTDSTVPFLHLAWEGHSSFEVYCVKTSTKDRLANWWKWDSWVYLLARFEPEADTWEEAWSWAMAYSEWGSNLHVCRQNSNKSERTCVILCTGQTLLKMVFLWDKKTVYLSALNACSICSLD